MSDESLSPDDEQALRGMKRDRLPPSRIENAVVDALVHDGLLVRRARGIGSWRLGMSLAACLAIAITAWLVIGKKNAPTAASGPRFVLLLYAGEDAAREGPGRRQEYAAWARGVAMRGTAISGEELADDESDRNGPRGFFVVSAADADAARAIAATCPHVRYGGRIVVRRIVSGS